MDATKLTAQEQEQEKAKFSFSGATLYGINAVIGSGIFLLPQKIYKGLGHSAPDSLYQPVAGHFGELFSHFDIVEVSPPHDIDNHTANLAASFVFYLTQVWAQAHD